MNFEEVPVANVFEITSQRTNEVTFDRNEDAELQHEDNLLPSKKYSGEQGSQNFEMQSESDISDETSPTLKHSDEEEFELERESDHEFDMESESEMDGDANLSKKYSEDVEFDMESESEMDGDANLSKKYSEDVEFDMESESEMVNPVAPTMKYSQEGNEDSKFERGGGSEMHQAETDPSTKYSGDSSSSSDDDEMGMSKKFPESDLSEMAEYQMLLQNWQSPYQDDSDDNLSEVSSLSGSDASDVSNLSDLNNEEQMLLSLLEELGELDGAVKAEVATKKKGLQP